MFLPGRFTIMSVMFSFVFTAQADEITARIYARDSNRKTILYFFKHESVRDGIKLDYHNVYSTPDGTVAVEERVHFENDILKTYDLEQKQKKEVGHLEVTSDKLLFKYGPKDKLKESDEKREDPVLVGSMIIGFIQKNWEKIQKGETFKFRLAVLDRRETIGFQIKKQAKSEEEGFVQVRMEPTSAIISLAVDPMDFYLDKNGKVFFYKGRVLPKKDAGSGNFKDLDAEFVYD